MAVLLSALGVAVGAGASPSAAQQAEIAHVEAVSGRVVASIQGKPTLLDVLDTISDRTRLDLLANSELRICHYQTNRVLTLRGPLRASVTPQGVAVESGKAVEAGADTCAVPAVSTFQGGLVTRGVGATPADTPPRAGSR